MSQFGYSDEMIIMMVSFLRESVALLKKQVKEGVYPDLHTAFAREAERLRKSNNWIDEQMKTTEGYVALYKDGFEEALQLRGFNNVLYEFYQRALHFADPESRPVIDIDRAASGLMSTVMVGLRDLHVNDSGEFEVRPRNRHPFGQDGSTIC